MGQVIDIFTGQEVQITKRFEVKYENGICIISMDDVEGLAKGFIQGTDYGDVNRLTRDLAMIIWNMMADE